MVHGEDLARAVRDYVAATEEEPPPLRTGESSDNINELLGDAARKGDGIFPLGPVSLFGSAWRRLHDRLEDAVGLDLGVAYTALYQRASNGPGRREAASGDFDIFGRWTLLGRDTQHRGILGFAIEDRERMTAIAPGALASELGSLWGTTSTFSNQGTNLAQLYWEQHLLDGDVVVTFGKLDADNFYNGNRASSSNTMFLNAAFSSNATRFHPFALAANVRVTPSERGYVSAGFGDLNGRKTTSGFRTFGNGEFYYALEFGWTPSFDGHGPGHYRVTFYYFDAARDLGNPAGGGVSISLDQELGHKGVVFLRYGYSDDVRTTRQMLAFGGGIAAPFGQEDDILAIGFAWGQPRDRSLDDQYVVEIFYRVQLTPAIQVTPHIQGIVDPSNSPGEDAIAVFGVRMRMSF